MKRSIRITNRSITLITMLIIIGLVVSCANPILAQETTITFAANTFIKGFYPSLASLADEFHKENPSITVQVVSPSEDDWTKSDLSTLASAADVTLLSPGLERPSGNVSYFKDLSPLMSSDTAFKSEDFWPGLLTACQDAQGKTVGLPMGVYGIGIFYDPNAFDAAGLAYPVPGWTWDDFRKYVTTLAGKTGGQARYGFVDATGFLVSLLAPAVDSYLESANGKIDPSTLAGQMQWYLDLAKTGSVFSFDQSSDNRLALFKDNVPAMWIGGLNDPSPSDSSQLARQGYGFAPFPTAADGSMDHTTPQLMVCGVISSGSAHPQEAWAWLDFLTHQKPESTAPNHTIPQIPSRQSVADANQYWASFTSQAATAVKFCLAHGWYGSLYQQTFDQVGEAMAQALAGQQDLSLALSQAVSLPGQNTPTPGVIAAVATPVPTQSTSAGTITITYAAPAMPTGDTTFDKLAEEFHRLHPDIVVNIVNNDWGCDHGGFSDCLTLKPDVFTANFKGFEDIGKDSAYVLSIDSFIAADDPALLNDFYPGLVNTFTYDGKLYGLPATAGIPLLYYNKDLLAAKGLTPPTTSWTLDDFLSMAAKVSSGGGPGIWTKDNFKAEANGTLSPQIFGATNVDLQILDFLAQGWIDTSVEPPVINLKQPQVLSALQRLSDLIKQGVILHSNFSPLGLDDVILTGRVAFWFGVADVSAGGFTQMNSSRLQVGAAPIPQGLNASDNLGAGMIKALTGHFISNDTKYPQACWQWIKFVSADPTSFYGVPARRSVAASSNWEARVGTQTATVFRTALAQVIPYGGPSISPYEDNISNVTHLFHNILGKVVAGSNPHVGITEEQEAIDSYMACVAPLDITSSSGVTPGVDNTDAVFNCLQKADPWSDLIWDWP